MRTRAGISTSDMHFIMSKRFQQSRQMPQKCPPPDIKALAPTVYPLKGRKVDPNLKKNFSEKNFFRLHYDQKNMLNPSVKSVFKSVHNNGRYLHFCDCHVCSFQYAAMRRLHLRAWPILRTGLRPVQLFLVIVLFSCTFAFQANKRFHYRTYFGSYFGQWSTQSSGQYANEETNM